eukprot:132700-Prorocentrum_minimum.AAC.3
MGWECGAGGLSVNGPQVRGGGGAGSCGRGDGRCCGGGARGGRCSGRCRGVRLPAAEARFAVVHRERLLPLLVDYAQPIANRSQNLAILTH